MSFKPFEEVVDLTLRLPFRGKLYTIYPVSAKTGMNLAKLNAAAIAKNAGLELDNDVLEMLIVDDDGIPDFARMNLGATYSEMLDDDLSHAEIELATQTAFLFHTIDREAAEIFWNTGGKAPAPSPRPGRRPTATPTRTAAANTTPPVSSPNGTSTRRKARAKAARSAGSSRTTTTSSSKTSTTQASTSTTKPS